MPMHCLLAMALIVTPPSQQTPSSDEPVIVVGTQSPRVSDTATPVPSPTPSPRAVSRRKPEIKVMCTPRMPVSGGIQAAQVTCTVLIVNPDERLWCPRVDWFVGELFNGGQESDCSPYDVFVTENGGPPEFWSEDGQPRAIPLWQGSYTIKAKLMKNGKVVGMGKYRIEVH